MINGSSTGLPPPAIEHGEQPDPDSMKLFVGQIPKAWTEADIRDLLEVYGPIYQLHVLREKGSTVSKGCCFVTFYTRKAALAAQNALHNVKTLPGVHHCVQVKPADSDNKIEDRKLFVGMISKKMTDSELRLMFSSFGSIEECRILLNPDGQSKGCAFVTFAKRNSAQTAIKHVHQSMTMEGCSAPIVVKIADSPKDKERKKTQNQLTQQFSEMSNQWNSLASLAVLAPMLKSFYNLNNSMASGGSNQFGAGLNPGAIQQFLSMASAAHTLLGNSQSNLNAGNSNMLSSPCTNTVPFPSGAGSDFASGCSSSTSPLNQMGVLAQCGLNSGLEMGPSSSANNSINPVASFLASMAALNQQTNSSNNQATFLNQTNSPAGSQKEGPEGANLFIYHLPSHFADHDLIQAFLPYGNVISAKVFIDKQTNLSKCFGFVSFDNSLSAKNAIQGMHGLQIGTKRLKVQHKRNKTDSKPY